MRVGAFYIYIFFNIFASTVLYCFVCTNSFLLLRCLVIQRCHQSTASAAATTTAAKGHEVGVLSNTATPQELRSLQKNVTFNLEAMTALLDHDNHEMRAKFRYGS